MLDLWVWQADLGLHVPTFSIDFQSYQMRAKGFFSLLRRFRS